MFYADAATMTFLSILDIAIVSMACDVALLFNWNLSRYPLSIYHLLLCTLLELQHVDLFKYLFFTY